MKLEKEPQLKFETVADVNMQLDNLEEQLMENVKRGKIDREDLLQFQQKRKVIGRHTEEEKEDAEKSALLGQFRNLLHSKEKK